MCAPCRFSPHDGSTGRFFHVENEALRRICWGSILTAQTPQTQHCAPIRWLWLIFAQNQASDSAQCRRAEPNRAEPSGLRCFQCAIQRKTCRPRTSISPLLSRLFPIDFLPLARTMTPQKSAKIGHFLPYVYIMCIPPHEHDRREKSHTAHPPNALIVAYMGRGSVWCWISTS